MHPSSKPLPGVSCVLGPGWDGPCLSVVIQWRQIWIPCQAGHSPGVREQQKGTLPLSRGAKGRVTLYTAFTPYPGPSDLPPKHLWEFSTSL